MRKLPSRGKPQATEVPKPPLKLVLEHYGISPADRREQKVRCPVHNDSTPSMSVNLDSGLFNCHACGAKGGDAIQLIRLKENCSFEAALRIAEAVTGVSYESLPPGASGGASGPSVEYVAPGKGIRLNVGGGRVSARPRRPSL